MLAAVTTGTGDQVELCLTSDYHLQDLRFVDPCERLGIMSNMTTALTDAEVARMMLALMACDTAWRSTDRLLDVTFGRVERPQMLRVLFDLHTEGKLNYARGKGWRFVHS